MRIIFTKHAEEKFRILESHALPVPRNAVLETIEKPEHIEQKQYPLFIVQKQIDRGHVLRVVCRREGDVIKVITFYPGRVSQYGKN